MVVGLVDMLLFRLTKEKIQWRHNERLDDKTSWQKKAWRGARLVTTRPALLVRRGARVAPCG